MKTFAKKAGEVTTALLQTGTCNLLNARQLDTPASAKAKDVNYKAPVTEVREVADLV